MRLRGRVRGPLSTGGNLEVDDNRLGLVCRLGSGPTVTPIPTSTPHLKLTARQLIGGEESSGAWTGVQLRAHARSCIVKLTAQVAA